MSSIETRYPNDDPDTKVYSSAYAGQWYSNHKDRRAIAMQQAGSTGSTCSKDSGYDSTRSSSIRPGGLSCLYPSCDYQTRRQYDLDRHVMTHFPGDKFDCPGRGCGRTGEHGFDRKDHLREHLRKIHGKDIPKRNSKVRKIPSTPQTFLSEDIERYNANLEAPSQLKAQDEDSNEMPSPPPIKPVRYSSLNLKPVELPKITELLGDSTNLDLRSRSSQYLNLAEESPGTAGGRKEPISHNVGEDDKESPSPTELERELEMVRNVQVAPKPRITHDKSISQGFTPWDMDLADAERSTMTTTGEHEVRDAVKPVKIMSEPDDEARPSTPDHIYRTTLLDAKYMDRVIRWLEDGLSDEDSDDVSVVVVEEDSCSNLNPVEHPANAIMVEGGSQTGFSGEPIEPTEDIISHQKPVELPKAIMDLDDPSMPRSLINQEKRIIGHVHPVELPENITKVKDAAQMNNLGNLAEAVDDQSSHLAQDAQVITKPVRMAPQYDAYVMTLLSLRIELRIWVGRRAPSPTIYISTSGETLLEDGKQRIRWTCRCGRHLYDDFEELRPGALEELEQTLNEQSRVCSSKGNGSSQHRGNSIRTLWNAAGGIIGSLTTGRPFRNNSLPALPLHQPHAAGQERNSQSSSTSEDLFLLMCIPYRKHGTKLVHMNLAELVSDETLFRKLRREYQSIRGQWASHFSLWKMTEIQFVKFGLHKHQLIDIKEKNDLPPENLKNEYRYQPIPAETIPPIGTNHMMHLYEHPDHTDDVPFCLERIPKKIREQLKLSPHQAPGLLGWGVYFAEGFDWPKFWIFGSVILSLSAIFGACWSTLRHDIQGGFGITACMMVAVTFTTGVVQAAVEQT